MRLINLNIQTHYILTHRDAMSWEMQHDGRNIIYDLASK
jgi:hypothetical protein